MNFKYEVQGETEFLICQKEETDIIDSMSMGMISNNRIEGLAPFIYVQMDNTVFFKYNISGKISVEQYFSGVVQKRRLLQVLKSMADALILAEEYMLEPSSFVLDSSYIYVDPNTAEVAFIVLPVIRDSSLSLKDFMKSLVFGIQVDQTEDCSYFAALISFLNAKQFFSIQDFKQQIDKLLQGNRPEAAVKIPPVREETVSRPEPVAVSISDASGGSVSFQQVSRNVPNSIPLPVEEVKPEVWNPIPEDKPEKKGLFSRKKEKKEKEKKEKRERKPLFGKKTKEEKPKVKSGNLGGLAIPGMDIPGQSSVPKLEQPAESQSMPMGQPAQGRSSVPVQQVAMQKHTVERQDFGGTVDLRALSEGTTVLTGTTVLNGTTVLTEPKQKLPFLTNLKTRERFVISKEASRIGKDPMRNDFCIQGNSAVSREHAVIHFQNGQVFVVDNHSTNGTYVNGRKLSAGEVSEALQHGTRVMLGDEELEYRTYE